MATSSITHNFVVRDPEAFITAFEESEREVDSLPKHKVENAQWVTDPEEIREFFARRKQNIERGKKL